VIRFRCVFQRIKKFGSTHEGKVKRNSVTSATVARARIDVNGPQYYYCLSQIQPDDTDTCELYCLYYFKRRHRGMKLPNIVKDFSTVGGK
jgi:hypothetical protein